MAARPDRSEGWWMSLAVTVVASAICFALYPHVEVSNLIMIYLLGVVFIASRYGRAESIFTSVLSVAVFDFSFVRPRWTLAVSHIQDIVTLLVMMGVAVLISSLTHRVREHERVALEATHRAEAESMRSTLLASVSHDLRTPLTSIAGSADCLVRGEGNPTELSKAILDQARRLNEQVQNLLDMTRLQWGELQPNLAWESMEELAAAAVRRAADRHPGLVVDAHVEPGLPLLRMDAELVERVFSNLIENAARYAPGGPVRIDCRRIGDRVAVTVADEGPGLPEGIPVFERFAGSGGGTGLGLAICQAIVTMHSGSIRASKREPMGAVIEFDIPIPPQPEPPSE